MFRRFLGYSAIALLTVLLSGATVTPQLTYTVGECDRNPSNSPEFTVTPQPQSLTFSHHFAYACCAQFRLEGHIENQEITITEVNDGGLCRCMCTYQIEGELAPLSPGEYLLKVYSMEDRNNNLDVELLFEQSVEIQ